MLKINKLLTHNIVMAYEAFYEKSYDILPLNMILFTNLYIFILLTKLYYLTFFLCANIIKLQCLISEDKTEKINYVCFHCDILF